MQDTCTGYIRIRIVHRNPPPICIGTPLTPCGTVPMLCLCLRLCLHSLRHIPTDTHVTQHPPRLIARVDCVVGGAQWWFHTSFLVF